MTFYLVGKMASHRVLHEVDELPKPLREDIETALARLAPADPDDSLGDL